MPRPLNHPLPPQAPHIERSERSLRIAFTSDPVHIAPVRTTAESFAANAGFGTSATNDIGLCINEAVANIIRHAYDSRHDQPIEFNAVLQGDVLTITLRDWGTGENPLPPGQVVPQPDPLTPGGLGLICMKRLMDDVVFAPQPRGMLLTLRRSRR